MGSALRANCRPALLSVLLLLPALAPEALGETRHVLVLSSSERPFAPQSGFADAVVRDLIQASRDPIQFIEISVQAARASGEAPDASIAQRIRTAIETHTLDLVMTIGGPAATFAQQFRHELFDATPVIFAGVDRRFVENGTFGDFDTTVATQHDPAVMIDEILRLLPETRNVMVVVGASQVEKFWLQQMKRDFARFGDRLQFNWTNELSFDEIKQRSRTMPANSAIFFAILALDGKGQPRVDGDTLKTLHAEANAPMFALYGVGRGIVGGPMLSTDELSRTTAGVTMRVLAGEVPARIRTPVQRPGQPTYDARELQRWHIDEARLPVASVVLFREPTMWQRNRRGIAIGLLLGAASVTAALLLVGRAKKRRAEDDRPADDSGEKLSNLSRHLLLAQDRDGAALAKTLHEDVCQRMVALTLRLRTLEGSDHDSEVADIRAKLTGLVGEIAAVTDPVYGRLELMGLATAGRGFCEEISSRYGVVIRFAAENVPRLLPDDIALALFRVLQEATLNAVVHSGTREIRVTVRGSATELRLLVVDRGIGFDPRDDAAGGIGLLAIRERLKLFNGDVEVTSAKGQGTRVEAWVPFA